MDTSLKVSLSLLSEVKRARSHREAELSAVVVPLGVMQRSIKDQTLIHAAQHLYHMLGVRLLEAQVVSCSAVVQVALALKSARKSLVLGINRSRNAWLLRRTVVVAEGRAAG